MNQPMRELPQYKCHKIVHALKIANIDVDLATCEAVITPEDAGYGPFAVDAAYMAKQKPRIGGYYVVYEDGYKSWSPADAFEKGYVKIDDQPNANALELVCQALVNVAPEIIAQCEKALNSGSRDSIAPCGNGIYWADLAMQLATAWWKVNKVGGTLQHGDLNKAETMFSVVLEQHGGQCFHAETPMEAWSKAHAWLVSPDRSNGEKPSLVALEIAARVWCDQEMERITMDSKAAFEIAQIIHRVRERSN